VALTSVNKTSKVLSALSYLALQQVDFLVELIVLSALQWGSRAREEEQQSRGGGVDWLCKGCFVRRLRGGGGFEDVEES